VTYDPFIRGPFPAGVRTLRAVDPARDRRLSIEIWYPASDSHAGQDVAGPTRDAWSMGGVVFSQDAVRDATPRTAAFPLVAFSHGSGGHRRQSTFLCTHLASHGYVVAAVDHVGNTRADLLASATRADVGAWLAVRPADVVWMIDIVLGRSPADAGPVVEADRVGVAGHSLGGWTALEVTGRDRRIRAALALAPAGIADPPPGVIRAHVSTDWGRDVPTFFLGAERDTMIPLDQLRELAARIRSTTKTAVLANADHFHFCDRVEEVHEFVRRMPSVEGAPRLPPARDLCPGLHAHLFARGLAVAHMDAFLKRDAGAAGFLADDVAAALRARGVEAEVST
jgi:predicted dienelactone hydrolase